MPRPSKPTRAATPSKKQPPAKKRAPVKKATPTRARVTAKKAVPAARKAAPAKKVAAAKKQPRVKAKVPAKRPVARATAPARRPVPVKKAVPARPPAAKVPVRKGPPDKFLEEQRELLLEERAEYVRQAEALKAEADQMAAEMEPGDVQFDEESGEGGTINVDRERDLALSAQARVAVEEIDFALGKIDAGTYGICEGCGQHIVRARLKAIPHARLCVACKSGGLSRR